MPIKFRCTGCRSKLYVPERWHGTSIVCPRCQTRVIVPAGGDATPTSLEGPDVERSLDALDDTGAAFDAAPFAIDLGAAPRRQGRRSGARRGRKPAPAAKVAGRRATVTLPVWVPYAFMAAMLAVAAGSFALGVWWSTAGRG